MLNYNIVYNRLKRLVEEGFFHILVGNVLIKMIAFLSSIVIVRLVSKQDYGYLAYADNLYQYINLLSGLGLSTAILKFCSPKLDNGINKYYLMLAIKAGALFQFVASLILCGLVFSVSIPFPAARGIILALVFYPLFTQLVATLQCYIRSKLDNKLYARMGVVQTIVIFFVCIPATMAFEIYGVVLARYLAMFVVICMGIRFLRSDLPTHTETIAPEKQKTRFFWRMAISMMLANLFSMVMPINEMFLINTMLKNELLAANYKVAILIPSQIVFVASSVEVYLFPKIAQLSECLKDAMQQTIKFEALLFAIIFCICIIGYVASPYIINFVYGNRYADAIELSKMYWIVYGVNAGFRMLPMNVLPAIGSTFFNSIVSCVSCVIHVFLLYFFIGKHGIYGAAYALLIVYLFSGIAYWGYFYFKCNKVQCTSS